MFWRVRRLVRAAIFDDRMLRPFAVTGAFIDELPFGATTKAFGFGASSGKAQSVRVPTVETLHWGLIQYSTYYLTSLFTGGPPKNEPLNELLPLVEFSFDSLRPKLSCP